MNNSFSILDNIDKEFIKQNSIEDIVAEEKLYSKKNDVYLIKVSCTCKSEKHYIYKEFKGEDRSSRLRREIYFYEELCRAGVFTFLKKPAFNKPANQNNADGLTTCRIARNEIGMKINPEMPELNVPRLYYVGESFLILEFLGRKNLLDYILEEENKEYTQIGKSDSKSGLSNYKPLLDALGFITDFNNYMKAIKNRSYILCDMNFRNFILVSDRIFRVDFEDCREGEVEEDAGKFIAFFLTYKPEFTHWKKQLAASIQKHCITHLHMNGKLLEEEILKEFNSMKSRRK